MLRYRYCLILIALVAQIAAPAGSSQPSSAGLGAMRIIDLTHAFDEKTVYWPTSPSGFELQKLHFGNTPSGYFYAAYRFCAPEHGGTHLDAPIHFAEGGWTVDQIPLDKLKGPAVVIDVRAQASEDPDYRLKVADIHAWEKKYGEIPAGAIVMLHTGWGARWPDPKRYLGGTVPGDASDLHFPSYGAESARFLIEQRQVNVLGVDTASIDYGPSKDFIVHRIAAAARVSGLENIANLDQLPPSGAWIIALPMKIGRGSGGPARVIALLPK